MAHVIAQVRQMPFEEHVNRECIAATGALDQILRLVGHIGHYTLSGAQRAWAPFAKTEFEPQG